MTIELFLTRLKIDQIQKLVNRYQLEPIIYKFILTYIHIPHSSINIANILNKNLHKKREFMTTILLTYMEINGIGECPICFETNNFDIAVATPCVHIFCDICLLTHLKQDHRCPMCRESVEYLEIIRQVSNERLRKILYVKPESNEPVQSRNEYIGYTMLIITISIYMYTYIINIINIIVLLYVFSQMSIIVNNEIFYRR